MRRLHRVAFVALLLALPARAFAEDTTDSRAGDLGLGAQLSFLGLTAASLRLHFGDVGVQVLAGSALLADPPAGGSNGGFALGSEGRFLFTFARHGPVSAALGAGGGFLFHTLNAGIYTLVLDAMMVVEYLATANLGIALEAGFGLVIDGPQGSALDGDPDQRQRIVLGARIPLTLGFHWYF